MSDSEELLEETPPEVLRAFLARELAADPDLERGFHSFLDTSDLEADIEYEYSNRPAFLDELEKAGI